MRYDVLIESKNSRWFFREDNKTYLRMPKNENARVNEKELLEDLVWHPYEDFGITCGALVIRVSHELDRYVYAPRAELILQ